MKSVPKVCLASVVGLLAAVCGATSLADAPTLAASDSVRPMNGPPGTPGRPDSDSISSATDLATKRSDNAITTKVKSELLAAKGLRPAGIRVSTENGVVHLDGKVQSDSEKLTALNAVRTVEGVQSVVDGLQVVGK
ncbi:BON domain-containing protein [Cupriavidus sp. D39]|uniref:BON domain-containing protein n=1 Tax=Cupriavidus sp. D39 TaxID=2997877 RepID=UPI00227170E5|nr:BON domain-containing protein [Cupriavidus sp. D39]MCY0853309.1 BON domain-containing protein [Cupriavidus sp. D39]